MPAEDVVDSANGHSIALRGLLTVGFEPGFTRERQSQGAGGRIRR